LCAALCDVGGYPGAHGSGMGGMGGMGGLGHLGSLFQDPELLQAFQVYLLSTDISGMPFGIKNC